MPFVTVLETDDNHDGLIDTFDIQARALAAATEQRRLLDPLNNIERTACHVPYGMWHRPFHTAGLPCAAAALAASAAAGAERATSEWALAA